MTTLIPFERCHLSQMRLSITGTSTAWSVFGRNLEPKMFNENSVSRKNKLVYSLYRLFLKCTIKYIHVLGTTCIKERCYCLPKIKDGLNNNDNDIGMVYQLEEHPILQPNRIDLKSLRFSLAGKLAKCVACNEPVDLISALLRRIWEQVGD